jgi:hypothetical protein
MFRDPRRELIDYLAIAIGLTLTMLLKLDVIHNIPF